MISGTLPNNTVWWLSSDGLKIWIESRDLEQEKFKEKIYTIVHGRIFHARKEVGELTKSRLDSRRGKDAWIIKLEAMVDIYPELLEEIRKKEIENTKKKKTTKRNRIEPKKRKIEEKTLPQVKEIIEVLPKVQEEVVEMPKVEVSPQDKVVEKVPKKEPIKDLFDINREYVGWIKEEIDTSESKKITIPLKDLKDRMGKEFINMHDLRIYFGLKKILSSIGIMVELTSSKGESVMVMKKVI